MSPLDIKDAFYSVPFYNANKNLRKFVFNGYLYRFEVTPKYYLDPMCSFTKLLKPPFPRLRVLGHSSTIYVDDFLFTAETYDEGISNNRALLDDLGFHKSLYLH